MFSDLFRINAVQKQDCVLREKKNLGMVYSEFDGEFGEETSSFLTVNVQVTPLDGRTSFVPAPHETLTSGLPALGFTCRWTISSLRSSESSIVRVDS